MTFFFHKPWQLMWDGFLYPDKLMEETEELSHQRAQREVRTLFMPLFFNHMTATAKMDFWLNNTHLTHMALKQLYLCVCAGAGASESGPGGGEDEVWGGGAGAEGRAGAYQTVKNHPNHSPFLFLLTMIELYEPVTKCDVVSCCVSAAETWTVRLSPWKVLRVRKRSWAT